MLIRYVEHSVAYRFLVLRSDVLDCNIIIETKNVEYFEHIFPLCDNTSHETVERHNENASNIEKLRRTKKPRENIFLMKIIFKLFMLKMNH